MKNRIEHVDIAKGISITLVALFHSKIKYFFPELIDSMSLFRVPLFFFLSGVFFSHATDSKSFFIRRAEGLLKPYFSVLLLLFILDVFIFKKEHLAQAFFGIFYGNGDTIRWIPMWFIPHLFAVHCFSYFLFRHLNFDYKFFYIRWAFLSLLLSLGTLYIQYFWNLDIAILGSTIKLPGLPFSTDIIFITSVYFISGYILRTVVIRFNINMAFLVLSSLIYLFIILFTNSHIDLNYRTYTNPILSTLGTVCGIYIILCLSRLIEHYTIPKRIFVSLGSASLYILIFHSFFGNKLFDFFIETTGANDSLLLAIIVFIFSIVLPLPTKWLIENNYSLSLFFLPFKKNKLLKHNRFTRQ